MSATRGAWQAAEEPAICGGFDGFGRFVRVIDVAAGCLRPARGEDRCAFRVSVASQTVVVDCASAGAAANRPSAPNSSARTGRRRERRARPSRGSGRVRSRDGVSLDDRERDGVEGAGRCAPASRRAHIMPLGRWA